MDKTYELLQDIRKCPEIYLGKKSIELLYAFLNGYRHHSDVNYSDCLTGFQEYIESIYRLNTDHNWANLIEFFSSTEEEAFWSFYKYFDNYMSNGNEDTSNK
jgi:hypothetical protein